MRELLEWLKRWRVLKKRPTSYLHDPDFVRSLRLAWRDCGGCIHGKEGIDPCRKCFDDPSHPDWEEARNA